MSALPGCGLRPDQRIDCRPCPQRSRDHAACARSERFLPCVCVQRTWKYSLRGVAKKRLNFQLPIILAPGPEKTKKFPKKIEIIIGDNYEKLPRKIIMVAGFWPGGGALFYTM